MPVTVQLHAHAPEVIVEWRGRNSEFVTVSVEHRLDESAALQLRNDLTKALQELRVRRRLRGGRG